MNEEPSPAEEIADEPSVFGNLPRSRPGARSPRRDAAAAKAGGREPGVADGAAEPEEDRVREARAQEPQAATPPPDTEPEVHESDRGGLEELAWAGVAAAAEAATLGVRLANRAMDSLRGGSEKP